MIIMLQRHISVLNVFALFGIKIQDNIALLLDQILNDCGAVPGSLLYHKMSQTLIARCKVGFFHLFYKVLLFVCYITFVLFVRCYSLN